MFDDSGNFVLYPTLLGIKVRYRQSRSLFSNCGDAARSEYHMVLGQKSRGCGAGPASRKHKQVMHCAQVMSLKVNTQVVNLVTSRVVRIIGKVENTERFLRIALYQVPHLPRPCT